MTAYPTVALAGATGSLGSVALEELLAAGVPVTVLTRKGANSTESLSPKPNLTIKEVDYNVPEDLTKALEGTEVVISTLGTPGFALQDALVDAAIAAGVKRFIPSEFGCDTANPKTRKLPVYAQKVAIQDKLIEKSKAIPSFSYTLVFNNAFFDWGIRVGFIINAKTHVTTLPDGGNRRFSVTRLSTIGKALVGVLANLDETKNKSVYVHDAAITKNELIAIFKKIDSQEWATTITDTAEIEADAYAELAKENPDIQSAMVGFIARAIYGEGYGGDFTERLWNELLGLPVLTAVEVEEVVRSIVAA
ncbi:related to 2`-hydroxyisoflavone reductase [Cephalotrichum gorgonifer]|uniref:Related to 2`-hydroxyisoflavone reductase n=1 Tax=Cephalotrichum gorgonifer TaxID=2041049 RepID=A0AAE8N4E9_9PEZI|nr:related to 2`-hydroxyisoflavone reductase [Cephalotrichum gorgonifer]